MADDGTTRSGATSTLRGDYLNDSAEERQAALRELDEVERATGAASGCPVVGIGASAGGLESLERFFTQVPRGTGLAFVVVQHLSPDFRSLIDELLARRTEIPIKQAEDGMRVEPDTVYLLPPRKEMIIRERKLVLTDKDPKLGLSLPIDRFFRSLAEDVGPNSAAIVLSGTGSDGSRGVLDVKRAGGLVLVESELSAQFDGMPLAAQRTGVVDHVLRPEEMPDVLCRTLTGDQDARTVAAPEESWASDHGLRTVFRLLREECSIDFSHYKIGTVRRRIERRMSLLRLDTIEQYADVLRREPQELNSLYETLLIGVTRFFRDKEAFDLLERAVIPELVARGSQDGGLRIWVPGCATGEEAYSLAILFHEQLTQRELPLNVKVFATDVHRRSLDVASAGIYDAAALSEVSPERMRRYFQKQGDGYQVSQDLRQLIVFAPHNMLRDAPFTKLDFISCRNVLIYFQPHAQQAAVSLFHFGLRAGGVLFLGSSETPSGMREEFDTIDERWRLFRKIRDVRAPADMRLSLLRTSPLGAPTPPAPRQGRVGAPLLATYDRLLDRFMPPSFLVDQQRQLVDTFGGAEKYLRMKARRPSNGFVELLPEGVRAVVASVLQRALQSEVPVRYDGLRIHVDGDVHEVNVVAERFDVPHVAGKQLLVRFEPVERPQMPLAPEEPHDGRFGAQALLGERVQLLESELAHSRENLQASVEELEASNEELQATNEELVASNEELQSTNEELHSVNEELYTVNAEYQKKIFELEELTTDFKHLLEGTDVGILYLDADLRIRKFTPRIAEVFGLVPHDTGRKLEVFAHGIERPTLSADVQRVLHEGAVVEDRVRDRNGTWFFMRILPYRFRPSEGGQAGTDGPPVKGVVITLTDISTLEAAQARLAHVSALVDSSDDAIISKRLDGTITVWNGGAERLYGYTAEEVLGKSVFCLIPEDRRDEELQFLERMARDERIDHVETVRLHKDGHPIHVSVTMSPIKDDQDRIVGISAIARDVTQLVAAREKLEEREARIRLLLESMAEGIYGLDLQGKCTFSNPSCARLLGLSGHEQIAGLRVHDLIPHAKSDGTACDPDECPLAGCLKEGCGCHSDDLVVRRPDGTTFPIECWSHPVSVDGSTLGAVVTFVDIAERKRAEEEIRTASRRREEFLAMLSHELRNPLAAVLSATKVLSLPAVESATVERARQVVQRQAKHMARLLDDLLDVARITRGSVELRRQRVDLRSAAQAAAEALRPLFEQHSTTLDLRLPDEPVPVEGDPDRLQQIHANLMGNACVYSPSGASVLVEMSVEGGTAVVRVCDRGIGIDPELLPHIFELFVQGQQQLDRSRGGLGIGLTLVQTLVQLHGGTVVAKSDGPGCGSEFVVRLPLSAAAVDTPDRGANGKAKAAAPATVLLIEDHDDARECLRMLLETGGYRILEARDGEAGLAVIDSERPDVAIIDIGLPVMDGYAVAREIRRNAGSRDMFLVALTGYGQDTDVARTREAGFDCHLTKPVDLGVLEEVLAERPSR